MRRLYSSTLLVDYGRSVEDAVSGGDYDWVKDEINSRNFPVKRSGMRNVTIEIVTFDMALSTGGVLDGLSGEGYHPAELLELLAFGEAHPHIQLEAPLIALGSVWQGWGVIFSPYLGGEHGRRQLLIHSITNDWASDTRFVVVQK